ncbi:SRPBCC family protein [Saccharopolyspora erythraea]|uniref:SRPBCC family protein n=1 Tax=Saccharopolyspora erythraea TaxID=1836 RepID=UPI001BA8A7A4|nr:SRPBCC family protein [Saccharopolyspora erythraea]QUH03648.1 SRPBCC family protein [Saccharopolyspora erythraea]
MRASEQDLSAIPGLARCESLPMDVIVKQAHENTKESYSHEEVYGDYCTLHTYIDCPPRDVFDYLADMYSQEEYTYSVRGLEPVDGTGLHVGWDRVDPQTRIYVRIESNPDALTVDYHAAWDQGDDLWMIYLFRVLPAELVLRKPGSVLLMTNCHHPYYTDNPYPEAAPSPSRPWVGELWPLFNAGHRIEMDNVKAILEHRHRNGIPIVDADAGAAR